MKFKLALGALVTGFAMVAIVGFVALTHQGNSAAGISSVNHRRSVDLDSENDAMVAPDNTKPEADGIEARSRFTRQAALSRGTSEETRNPNFGHDMSCFTASSNNTIPAAHIKGHGHFKKPDGSSLLPGYHQRWRCSDIDYSQSHNPAAHNTHAFVDGGMCFNQTEKKIIVPKCGYYQVFSQILFEFKQNSPSDDSHTVVYHLLKFNRNCPSWEETPLAVMGRASVHPGNTTTTHTSDVIKLCKGGKIWVEIPENPLDCFPKGDDHATFMGAVLVAETTCHWPPDTTMSNEDHSHDE